MYTIAVNRSRADIERQEDAILAPYAVKSKGADRLYMDGYQSCNRRTEFERDKDRIIYSLAFKRLMEKTQVYLTHEGDHYTNRLTHTLEVAQIARSVASSLGLNQSLIEAISLGHDVGHTPFGHAVENVLDEKLSKEDGFLHNYQSLLVLDILERKANNKYGINLTNYTRYGILHHTKAPKEVNAYKKDKILIDNKYKSIESELVNKIDTITYLYHDLEDAINNKNFLHEMKLNDKNLFKEFLIELNSYTELSCNINNEDFREIKDLWLDYNPNTILKAMIKDLIVGTQKQIKEQNIKKLDDVQNTNISIASFNCFDDHFEDFKKQFIGKYIYNSPIVNQMDKKAKLIANRLFDTFSEKPEQLPYRTRNLYERAKNRDFDDRLDDGYVITPNRVIANYIAGMTDRYALLNFKKMFE